MANRKTRYRYLIVLLHEHRHTSARRMVLRIENRHRPVPLFEGDRAKCFESWMTELHQTRNSATESIPASLTPLRAPVGSNTETDDDCRPATFHRGAFGAKAPFSI